jgi:hypothetical protein
LDLINSPLRPAGLTVKDVDRIVFGARSVQDGSLGQYMAVVFSKEPLRLDAAGEKHSSLVLSLASDDHTIWTCSDGTALAYCAVEERILLIGEPRTLQTVLARNGPAQFTADDDNSWTLPTCSSDLAITLLPLGEGWPEISTLPFQGILEGIDAVGLMIDFDTNLDVQVSALCDDEVAAGRISRIATGLFAYAQMHPVEKHVLPNMSSHLRKLVDTAECSASGRVVTMQLAVPHELIQLSPVTMLPGLAGPTVPGQPSVPPQPWADPQSKCTPPGVPTWSPMAPPATSQTGTCAAPYYPVLAPGGFYPPAPSAGPVYNNAPVISCPAPPPPQRPTLSVAELLRLVEAGVAEEVILGFLAKHQLADALSVDDLILLTEKDASTQVIVALQKLGVASKSQPAGRDKRLPPSSSEGSTPDITASRR